MAGKQEVFKSLIAIRFGMRGCNRSRIVSTEDGESKDYWMGENLALHFHSCYRNPSISKITHAWTMQQSPSWSHLQFLTSVFYPWCHLHSNYLKNNTHGESFILQINLPSRFLSYHNFNHYLPCQLPLWQYKHWIFPRGWEREKSCGYFYFLLSSSILFSINLF